MLRKCVLLDPVHSVFMLHVLLEQRSWKPRTAFMDDKVLEDAAGAKKNTPIDSNDISILYIL